ncbi:MAG TPA: transposase [Verrucomicrobiota bacterium]|nr:transposase [Verrucomicrobiota bacterium]HNU50572.1 transposase [Verrucomicrobiota bacterium]
MARPLRIERAGGWYHVSARGNERRAIYRDDRDRRHFLEVLAEMVLRYRVRLHGFVLMDNHYHLLLELTEANLSRAVQWVNVSYSVWFNRRHERSGHLFQGRFKSVAVSPEEWALALSRYVHLNPVRIRTLGLGKRDRRAQRVGLSPAPDADQVRERIALLRGYRWSSYRAYIGLERAPAWLECQNVLSLGGGPERDRRRRYREYVERAVREGVGRSPWESVREQVVLGGAEFLAELRAHVSGSRQEQRGAGRLLAERPGLEAVIAAIEKVKGLPWADFRDRYGDTGRDMALTLGRRLCGLKLAEVAQAVGLRHYGVVATSVKRYAGRLAKDRAERERMQQVLKRLNCEM